MFRKLLISILVVMFTLSTVALAASNTPQENTVVDNTASAKEMTVLDKTAAVEKIIYGTEQTGSLVERTNKLEKDIYGSQTKDALISRMDRLYTYVKETSAASPSFISKLNAVEWTLTRAVTAQPAKTRIENMEHVLLGNTAAGSFDDRLTRLVKLAYVNGQIDVASTALGRDTLVKISMVSPLGSRTSRPGDSVAFQAADDVYVGGLLVIAKGAQGTGKVTKVEPSKNFGRDAQLQISFDSMDTIDGNTIDMILGDKAKEETKSLAKAAGASVAGMAILGPIGIVGGAFVHGQEITIPAGTEMYIQTKADTDVFGIQAKEIK